IWRARHRGGERSGSTRSSAHWSRRNTGSARNEAWNPLVSGSIGAGLFPCRFRRLHCDDAGGGGMSSDYDPRSARAPGRERVGKALDPEAETPSGPQTIAAGQLRAFIERIERLNEDKAAIGDDIKEVFAEAKATGFDTKAIRALIRLRNMDDGERQEA